jgi:hypothetical protein
MSLINRLKLVEIIALKVAKIGFSGVIDTTETENEV